jgi:glutathione S-transferase
MSTIKLYYFDIYGRAESIRMLLAHAKQEFEDVRINGEQLQQLKAEGKLEFGQVPLLEHNGKNLVQSWSILRYLGKQFGYYPETSEEAWAVDSLVDACEDYLTKYFRANFEKDEERKKQLTSEFLAWLPSWLTAIQKRIQNNADPKFAAGTKRTIADFALGLVAFNLIFNEANPHYAEVAPLTKKEDYPVLATYVEGLQEELKDYLTARPQPRPF